MRELGRFFELLHLGVWFLLGGGVLFIGPSLSLFFFVLLPLVVGLLVWRFPRLHLLRLGADLVGIAGLVAPTGLAASPFAMFAILPLLEAALLFSRPLTLTLLVVVLLFLAGTGGDITTRYFLAGLYLLAVALGLYVRERVTALAGLYERLRLDRRTILENMESGVMAFGRDGSLLYDNPAARRLLIPGAFDTFRREAIRALRQDLRESEIRVEDRVYGVGWTRLPEGRGVLAIFQDITDKRRLEARLKALDRWATLGNFSSHLAHEIRSAVMTLRGVMEIWESLDDPERERYRQHVEQALNRLQELVEDFLTYARVGSPLSLETTPLERLRDHLSREVNLPFEVRGTGPVVTDVRRVGWIVRNLVENARRYGREVRGVLLGPGERFQDPLGEVHIPDGRWAIVIRDNGPGIPENVRSRIFEPFFTTEPSGFGLGLAIVKETAEQLGGEVRVLSREGKGTLFAVVLPLKPVDLSAPSLEVSHAPNAGD